MRAEGAYFVAEIIAPYCRQLHVLGQLPKLLPKNTQRRKAVWFRSFVFRKHLRDLDRENLQIGINIYILS